MSKSLQLNFCLLLSLHISFFVVIMERLPIKMKFVNSKLQRQLTPLINTLTIRVAINKLFGYLLKEADVCAK